MPLALRTLMLIYFSFITKALLELILIKYNKANNLTSKISVITLEILLYLCYIIALFISFDIFSNLPNSCFLSNTFMECTLFCLLLLGLISISKSLLNGIVLILFFPLMIYSFFDNPREFYSQFGMDPEIVKSLPTLIAGERHKTQCAICTENIKEGDEIIVLRCPGKHFFHAPCIKSWLRVKVLCPLCRNENIL